MASEAGMKQLYLVGNRVMNDAQKAAIQSFADKNGLQVLAFIPFDTNITDSDMLGKTPLLNKEIPSVKTIDNICELLLKKTESTA
jgi:CO dehydrogenase nickel-insertion accessory protein CooC1